MCINAGTFCCTCVQIHLADLQIILALLGSLEFDLKPTAKRGNPFITMAPLIITFYCMFWGKTEHLLP